MASPTDTRAANCTVLLLILSASCSRFESPDAAYQRARSAFVAGDLSRASVLAVANAARYRSRPASLWFWKFRLLQAEALTGQNRTKEANALLADPVPPVPELSQMEVRRLIDQAALRSGAEAAGILARARAAVIDPELAIRIKLFEGIFALTGAGAGEAAFRAALAMAERQASAFWQAAALLNLSYSCKVQHRYEESVAFGLRALNVAGNAGARKIAAQANGNLGSAYWFLGEADLALDHEERAARTLEAIGDRSGFMIALGELGLMYSGRDDIPKAIANYQRAFEIAKQLGRTRDAERHAGNIALAFIKDRQWDAAADWNGRAAELAPLVSDRETIPYLARNRARIAYGRGQSEAAAQICQDLLRIDTLPPNLRWEPYELLGTIDAEAKRFTQANREFAAALKIIDGKRSDLVDSHYRITLLSRLMPFYQAYVDALVEQDDDAGALHIVESSRARVLAERLGRVVRADRFPDRASLQRLARSTNSALLSFWFAPARSFAWLITANGVRRFQLPPAAEIEKLVTAYREVIEHPLKDPILAKDPSGPKLWNALMAGIAPEIPKNSRVIVIPDGALHRLNLETLVAPSPEPHYWIEDAEISVAPSITIAASAPVRVAAGGAAGGQAGGETAGAGHSLLVIGAPDYSGTQFAPLSNAATEVRDIETRFAGSPLAVYTGPRATPAAYRASDPGHFAIIHFAAHAEANRENPLESAVILSRQDGQNRLYARDVIDVPIHANLVTISACRSAGVRAYAGEGLIGFAWAFLQAGARTVVAGLWDVSDSSTEPLMNRFYSGVAGGQSPVAAMRRAKLALARDDSRYRKPFYWGPFQVYIASSAAASEALAGTPLAGPRDTALPSIRPLPLLSPVKTAAVPAR